MNAGLSVAARARPSSARRTHIIGLTAFTGLAAALFVCHMLPQPVDAATRPRFKAVAFDYLVLFDPDSVVPAVEQVVA